MHEKLPAKKVINNNITKGHNYWSLRDKINVVVCPCTRWPVTRFSPFTKKSNLLPIPSFRLLFTGVLDLCFYCDWLGAMSISSKSSNSGSRWRSQWRQCANGREASSLAHHFPNIFLWCSCSHVHSLVREESQGGALREDGYRTLLPARTSKKCQGSIWSKPRDTHEDIQLDRSTLTSRQPPCDVSGKLRHLFGRLCHNKSRHKLRLWGINKCR